MCKEKKTEQFDQQKPEKLIGFYVQKKELFQCPLAVDVCLSSLQHPRYQWDEINPSNNDHWPLH